MKFHLNISVTIQAKIQNQDEFKGFVIRAVRDSQQADREELLGEPEFNKQSWHGTVHVLHDTDPSLVFQAHLQILIHRRPEALRTR